MVSQEEVIKKATTPEFLYLPLPSPSPPSLTPYDFSRKPFLPSAAEGEFLDLFQPQGVGASALDAAWENEFRLSRPSYSSPPTQTEGLLFIAVPARM